MSKNSGTTELLTRRVAKILPSQAGLEKLLAKQKIRVYLGVDPTGTRLHLGHAIGLRKLMEFASAGHEAILVFGTGTVLVGDPSLRDSARSVISQKEADENIKSWKAQASKIIDFSKVQIRQNGEWLLKLKLADIIKIASNVSATQLFKRDSFKRRGDAVWYHETMYPLLQGYDSVVLDVDLEIGGTDQEFNMLIGRELLKKMKNKDKFVLTTPMILGTDGKTMSKSSNNCVWLDDSASEMYGKLMAVADDQIMPYLRLITDVPDAELAQISKMPPRDAKAHMAYEVTKLYHDEAKAKQASEAFDAQFKQHKAPADINEVKLSKTTWDIGDLLTEVNLVSSKSEARRLLAQGGVRLNSNVQTETELIVKSGDVLQVGKRKFIKIKV